MQYHKNPAFNENMLRPVPCWTIDRLADIVNKSGAASADYAEPEDVENLCAKCVATAEKWAQTADRLWNEAHGCATCPECAAVQEEANNMVASAAK